MSSWLTKTRARKGPATKDPCPSPSTARDVILNQSVNSTEAVGIGPDKVLRQDGSLKSETTSIEDGAAALTKLDSPQGGLRTPPS